MKVMQYEKNTSYSVHMNILSCFNVSKLVSGKFFFCFFCNIFSKSVFVYKSYTVTLLSIVPYHASIDWSFRVNRLDIFKIPIFLHYFGKISLDTELTITYLCFNIVRLLFLIMESRNESTKSGIFCPKILYTLMNIYHIKLKFLSNHSNNIYIIQLERAYINPYVNTIVIVMAQC